MYTGKSVSFVVYHICFNGTNRSLIPSGLQLQWEAALLLHFTEFQSPQLENNLLVGNFRQQRTLKRRQSLSTTSSSSTAQTAVPDNIPLKCPFNALISLEKKPNWYEENLTSFLPVQTARSLLVVAGVWPLQRLQRNFTGARKHQENGLYY